MSQTLITIEQVTSVEPHPNADRLDVIKVLGYQVVTGKGNFEKGDPVVYFPPDILLPANKSEDLGVTNYLKHAVYPGETEKRQCRVGAARLRGVPSHGFVAPLEAWCGDLRKTWHFGRDVTYEFGGEKYVPPVREGAGDALPELETFHKYTDIENLQRFPNAIPVGTQVVMTEKIHGTNCRMGLCRDNSGEHIYCAGSHKLRREEKGLYWRFMTDNVREMLSYVSDMAGCADVVVFGEIFGKGVQDLSYGLADKAFRAFDISVNGVYMDYGPFLTACQKFNVETVPQLYVGEFLPHFVDMYTYGDTVLGSNDKFKGREGVVIKPVSEEFSDVLGGRMIVKSISADYLDRKGAKDIE